MRVWIAVAVSCFLGGAPSLGFAQSLLQAHGLPLPNGVTLNGDILYPPLSYDGRYIAFHSTATNLIASDTNRVGDVFVLDLSARLIQRVGVNSAGQEGNGPSTYPSLAGEARHVVFTSEASNLVPNDTNGASDVFLADLQTGNLTLVSRGMSGNPAGGPSYNYFPAVSSDGRYVVFNSAAPDIVPSDTNNEFDVFVFDRATETVRLVSAPTQSGSGDGPSMHGVVSGNGRYAAFHSRASNLVPNDSNGAADVFLADLAIGALTLISRTPNGVAGNARSERASIDFDGLRVSFSSDADDLVLGDTNGAEDVFVFDQTDNSVSRVSVLSGGEQMEVLAAEVALDRKSVIAPNGNAVAFRSGGDNLVDASGNPNVAIYLHHIDTGETELISNLPNGAALPGDSEHHALSFDGSVAAFSVVVQRTPETLQSLEALRSFGIDPAQLEGGVGVGPPAPGVSLGFIRNLIGNTLAPIVAPQ